LGRRGREKIGHRNLKKIDGKREREKKSSQNKHLTEEDLPPKRENRIKVKGNVRKKFEREKL